MIKKYLYAHAHSDATGGAGEREVENFLEETAMMKKVSSGECCHVVQMVGCVSTALPLALALEFVPYGNLLSYLKYWRKKVHTTMHAIYKVHAIRPIRVAKIHVIVRC